MTDESMPPGAPLPFENTIQGAPDIHSLKRMAAAIGYKLTPLEDYEPKPEPPFDALAEKIRLTPEQAARELELARKVAESKKLQKEMAPEEIEAWYRLHLGPKESRADRRKRKRRARGITPVWERP